MSDIGNQIQCKLTVFDLTVGFQVSSRSPLGIAFIIVAILILPFKYPLEQTSCCGRLRGIDGCNCSADCGLYLFVSVACSAQT